ncbi:MAG: tetratricopeptide repeat protein [Pirellulaceae bacterium]|nr:tetratricopeptide repeat protein [Pirellulaceae bacterium]
MQPLNPKDLLTRLTVEDESSTPGAPRTVLPTRFQELERQLQDVPLTVAPYLELAEIYLTASRWLDARRVLEKAVARFPDDPQANFLHEESQLARSAELLQAAQREYDAEPTVLTQNQLRQCQLEWNVLRERVYRQRLAREPQQVELSIPLAEALEQLDRVDEAIAVLQAACHDRKSRAKIWLTLAKLLERAHQIPQALAAYRRAALYRVPPPTDEIKLQALQSAADLAERSKMIDSARRYLSLLLEIQPGNILWQQRLAELQRHSL